MTQEIKSGQIYRHYKGKIAMVLAIAKFVPERRFVFGNPQPYTYCRAKSTEEDYAIDIFYEADGTLAQTHIVRNPVPKEQGLSRLPDPSGGSRKPSLPVAKSFEDYVFRVTTPTNA